MLAVEGPQQVRGRETPARAIAMSSRILVTGATGKVGQAFLQRVRSHPPPRDDLILRVLCHRRPIAPAPNLEMMQGSISDAAVVRAAMDGVTHVLHLATCKETPDAIMDVAVKGMFWLLEAARGSSTLRQFILIGGDAGMGHFVYPHPLPVTETQRHSAYPGCYALSKVLEEVMLEQYGIQYGLNGCCLRAPWIMEKDDFKAQLSFGPEVFGGPRWCDLVGPDRAGEYARAGCIPVMLDPAGVPVKRNFVHVDDLVDAILCALDHPRARRETFNICMDEPVDYRALAEYLARTRGLPSVDVSTPYHSTWLDNTKAKFLLGWRPRYDLARLADAAFDYRRAPDDPRVIWYPG
jgi:nucleoside-diphosphate-sugar epimerase